MATPPGPDSSGPATPIALYPGECYQTVLEARTFLRVHEQDKMPYLMTKFLRICQLSSVPIRGTDDGRVELQVRSVEEPSQDLEVKDEKTWNAIKKVALKYGATYQDDNGGYDPVHEVDGKATSHLRVRWVVKDLTPPPSTPSVGSPELSFENIFWDCGKVRDVTSSNVSPTNDAEAAAQISDYVRASTPAPRRASPQVWWAVESAANPDPEEKYRAALRRAREQGLDTAPLRSTPAPEEFVVFREARRTGAGVPQDQRPALDNHRRKLREDRARRR